MFDFNYSFLIPLLGLIVFLWLVKEKHYKIAGSVAFVTFLLYNGVYQSTVVDNQTSKVRSKNDTLTFDRHHAVDDSVKAEEKDFKTEMQEEHSQLREESEELLNRYLQGSN